MRRLLIRLVPVMTKSELMTPETGRRSMLQSGALIPLSLETPLVIDHDEDRRVGRVLEFYEADDSGGGRWTWARCEVTDAPGWLRRGGGCSWGYHVLQEQAMPGGWTRVLRAVIREVSILSPSVEPAEPRARVWWLDAERA